MLNLINQLLEQHSPLNWNAYTFSSEQWIHNRWLLAAVFLGVLVTDWTYLQFYSFPIITSSDCQNTDFNGTQLIVTQTGGFIFG